MTTTHWKAAAAEKQYNKLMPRILRLREQGKTLVEIADILNRAGHRTVDGTEFGNDTLCLAIRNWEGRRPAKYRPIDQSTIDLVQKLADEGRTVAQIVKHLNREKIRTEYGRKWGIHNMRRMIREWGIKFPSATPKLVRAAAVAAAQKAEETATYYAKIIPKIRRLQEKGHSYVEIAEKLNDEGVTNSAGGPFTDSLLSRIMQRAEGRPRQHRQPLDPRVVNKMIDMRNAGKTLVEIAEYFNNRNVYTAAGREWNAANVHYVVHGKDR